METFIAKLDAIRKRVNSVASAQLHSKMIKDDIREIVKEYFNEVRPSIASDEDSILQTIDSNFQELLVLCHKNGAVNSYKQKLDKNRRELVTLSSRIIAIVPVKAQPSNVNSIDVSIIRTLQKIVPSAALSYEQALKDLQGNDRLSWRGPATDLREALRETLDYLAPDKDVEQMPGYKIAKDAHGPTMKQKVRFVLSKRGLSKSVSETTESAAELVESGVGAFVRSIYTRSSISTHTPTNKSEVLNIRNYVRVALSELLEIEA